MENTDANYIEYLKSIEHLDHAPWFRQHIEEMKNLEYNPINGMPLDGRVRPVYVIMGNKHTIVVSDGKGNAYVCENDLYKGCNNELINNHLIDPTTYIFERGISGQEF